MVPRVPTKSFFPCKEFPRLLDYLITPQQNGVDVEGRGRPELVPMVPSVGRNLPLVLGPTASLMPLAVLSLVYIRFDP